MQAVTTIGGDLPEMQGDWLWHGGNLGDDGCIYGVPCNAERILKINPRTSEVSLIGGPFKVSESPRNAGRDACSMWVVELR